MVKKIIERYYHNVVMSKSTETNGFKRISIPLFRRIYPQLIADKLISVQPLIQQPQQKEEKPKKKESKYRSLDDSWEPI
jgi:hypothetical protein